jgi:hypothetical protein
MAQETKLHFQPTQNSCTRPRVRSSNMHGIEFCVLVSRERRELRYSAWKGNIQNVNGKLDIQRTEPRSLKITPNQSPRAVDGCARTIIYFDLAQKVLGAARDRLIPLQSFPTLRNQQSNLLFTAALPTLTLLSSSGTLG